MFSLAAFNLNSSICCSGYDIYLAVDFVNECQDRVDNAEELITEMEEREAQLIEIRDEVLENYANLSAVRKKDLFTEAYLEPNRASTMESFCGNSWWCFSRKLFFQKCPMNDIWEDLYSLNVKVAII